MLPTLVRVAAQLPEDVGVGNGKEMTCALVITYRNRVYLNGTLGALFTHS